ncbi:unnamed protein product [Diatraea saccharalis]|uniref:Glucose-methanol-choline oxidoreductase N-terminal domain-containing protein n=1 Tax=Diatraea saccharalis TaxID=40085 RepID=A0A9N9WGY1_9NEOP|nr:unnamed protein product [Diatraea saccharalis]
MSSQIWQPPDITAICAEQNAPLTQCSHTGFVFLALLTQLFGSSKDYNILDNPYPKPFLSDYRSPPLVERTISEPAPIKHVATNPHLLGPPLNFEPHVDHKIHAHSYGPKGSQGFSESSFFLKPDLKLDFEKFPPRFDAADFESNFFANKHDFFDVEPADSEKVTVVDKAEIITEKSKAYNKNKRKRKKRYAPEVYDFIVVGAGSAGCVIANRLSEVKKWKSSEAGPEEPDVTSVPAFAPVLGNSNIDWRYRTQPEELTCRAHRGQTCPWFSGRVMGGSSSINYLVYMRGNKRDYDDWAALGNYGWSYDDVLPYFKKSENNQDIEAKDEIYHGVDGPLTVERFTYLDKNVAMIVKAFHETGLPLVDFNGEQQIGTMTTQATSKDGKRMSSNSAFIRPVRHKRSNLFVRSNAQVTKILIHRHKKIAYGVKYMRNGVWHEVRALKEVVLSAGALNSPRILMLSGIGPEKTLKELNIPVLKNLKVGYNLQDHATMEAMLMGLTNKTSTSISSDELINGVKKYHSSKHNDGPLSATGPLYVTAFVRTPFADEDETVPDIQYHFDGRNLREFYSDPTTYLATRTLPLAYYDSINVRPILLSPKSRGYLTLNKTDPVFGQPLIYPRFFTDKRDVDTLVAALEMIQVLEKTKAFRENGVEFIRVPVEACVNYEWGTYDYFFCLLRSYTATIFHPAGTCRMGPPSDKEAVVNPRLKVYGIRHLRVADLSIVPNIIRGNTNAPAIMIGEKVSDMIKEDWNHYF